MLISLGIESTAHTFGIGIVDEEGNIYFNGFVRFETKEGGIHPREAAEYHKEHAVKLLDLAVKYGGFIKIYEDNTLYIADKASILEHLGIPFKIEYKSGNIREGEVRITRWREIKSEREIGPDEIKSLDIEDLDKINLISVSKGPGLYPTLAQGIFFARELSLFMRVPIVGVNHIIAHIEVAKLSTGFKDPVILFTSGANTQIIAFEGGRYRIFGETLDMGLGNFLDSFGRLIGIGFPAGPKIEELARKGRNLIEIPYTVKGMDIQLSGIYTYLKNLLEREKNVSMEDLCYSVQEHVFAMLVEITERAVAHLRKREVILTGGVAANRRLREMMEIMAKDRGIKFGTVPLDLANDNGTMIAWTGIDWYKRGWVDDLESLYPNPYWRAETVDYSSKTSRMES